MRGFSANLDESFSFLVKHEKTHQVLTIEWQTDAIFFIDDKCSLTISTNWFVIFDESHFICRYFLRWNFFFSIWSSRKSEFWDKVVNAIENNKQSCYLIIQWKYFLFEQNLLDIFNIHQAKFTFLSDNFSSNFFAFS